MAVLVAYASAFGSTREIAERIAARMGRAMVDVECRQVDDIEAASGEMPLRDHELFSGVYQASQMPPLLRGLFRLTGGKFGDLRDWEAVDAWADQIIAQLPTPPSPDSPVEA